MRLIKHHRERRASFFFALCPVLTLFVVWHLPVQGSLAPGQTAVELASIKVRDVAAFQTFAQGLQCDVQGLSCRLPVLVSDVFRPCPYTTAQYGQTWKTLGTGAERKMQVQTGGKVTAPEQFMAIMGSTMHVHPVQTIKQEMIVAGKLLCVANSPAAQLVVLIHGKILGGGAVSCIVRSVNPSLSDATVQALQIALK